MGLFLGFFLFSFFVFCFALPKIPHNFSISKKFHGEIGVESNFKQLSPARRLYLIQW